MDLFLKNYREGAMKKEKEYLADDRPLPPCPEIDNMTDEELEAEFQKRFGAIKKQNNE